MRIYTSFFFLVAFNFLAIEASTQTISIERDTLTWSIDAMTDVANDTTFGYSCKFVSYPGSKVIWLQPTDNYITEFEILRSSGTWKDVNEEGSKEYLVRYFGRKGKLMFRFGGGDRSIAIELPEDGSNSLPYIFHVSKITK